MQIKKVKSIKRVERDIDYTYNVKVARNHNYFAKDKLLKSLPILVHNCDDPHNVKEVESDVSRIETILWWDEVMSTRCNDPKRSARVIIMQRSHEGDLTGHVLSKEGVDYVHLCLPARYEPDRLLTRTPLDFKDPRTKHGEPLCPERYGDKELGELEAELGAYASAGQLQQRPHPRGGGMFEVHKFAIKDNIDPAQIAVAVRYWDKAGTSALDADSSTKRTAGVLMYYMKDKSFVVADVVKGKWSSTIREKIIRQTAEMDGRKVRIWIEQEPGSGGKESAEGTVRNLAGYSCRPDRVTGSKEARADQYAAQVGVENVTVLRRTWTSEFIREHESFPTGRYSDQCDAASGAFNKLFKTKRAGTWGKRH
ncbi:hypothetical protein DRH14_03995 [Candidatus Shapirobacteria bacterium]|nr:MAG: hypothetical protein DRH14_03995 [Candidatus Shapirobacteria bacterium]